MTDNTKNYTKDHCWQYDIRLNNLAEDLDISSSLLGIGKKQFLELKVSDLVFAHEPKEKVFKEVKALSKDLMLSCEKRISAPKHKYAFLLGKTKKETKELTKIFKLRNKIYPFPKNR